jgi:hypothetical protein
MSQENISSMIKFTSYCSKSIYVYLKRECAEYPEAPQAKDDAMAKWLWAVSEKWTRLSSE